MAENVSLLAGKPVTPGKLINVPRLVTAISQRRPTL